MNDEPDQITDADEPGDGEAQEGGVSEQPAPASTFGLSDKGLGEQWFIVADDEIKETFGTDAYDDLESGRARWAARFSGVGLDGPSADPIKTAALLRRVAITARWIANGLFPGHMGVPGFVLGEASHSIILEFTLAPEEKAVRIADFSEVEEAAEEDLVRRHALYPSVEGGRYFAALLATADAPDQLVEHLRPIGKQAVQTYQGALKELVEFEAELDLLVPAVGNEGEPVRRRVNVPVPKSESGLKTLSRKPKETSYTFEVEGLLYAQNSLSLGFGIQRDNEAHVTGEYDLHVADKLGPAWNKRVWARVEEIGPEEEWMPRAGRTRRVLLDVVVLKEGESRLGDKRRSRAAS